MRITPIDVANKQFTSGFRGYQRAEVQAFLRDIAQEYARLVEENAALRERTELLARENERFLSMETALKNALIQAQMMAEETRTSARREADVMVKDAQSHTAAMVEDAERQVEGLNQQSTRFRQEFRALLEHYLQGLDNAREPGVSAGALQASGAIPAERASVENDGVR